MIGSAAGLSFMDFVVNTGSVIVIILAVTVLIYYFMYRGQISVIEENMHKVMELDENRSIKDKPLLIKSVIMTVVVVIGFVFHSQLQVESATVALFAAGFMLVFGKQDAEEIILGVEWSTILFFIGLFVVVGGMQKSGVITSLAELMMEFIGNNEALGIVIILWVSAIISSFLDNIPFVATLIPLILTMESGGVDVTPLWWALSLGACLGGNGTLVGASANVVLAGVSAKNGYPITFMQYTKNRISADAYFNPDQYSLSAASFCISVCRNKGGESCMNKNTVSGDIVDWQLRQMGASNITFVNSNMYIVDFKTRERPACILRVQHYPGRQIFSPENAALRHGAGNVCQHGRDCRVH